MKQYFMSINYDVDIQVFDLNTYQFKFSNYFKNQDKITKIQYYLIFIMKSGFRY